MRTAPARRPAARPEPPRAARASPACAGRARCGRGSARRRGGPSRAGSRAPRGPTPRSGSARRARPARAHGRAPAARPRRRRRAATGSPPRGLLIRPPTRSRGSRARPRRLVLRPVDEHAVHHADLGGGEADAVARRASAAPSGATSSTSASSKRSTSSARERSTGSPYWRTSLSAASRRARVSGSSGARSSSLRPRRVRAPTSAVNANAGGRPRRTFASPCHRPASGPSRCGSAPADGPGRGAAHRGQLGSRVGEREPGRASPPRPRPTLRWPRRSSSAGSRGQVPARGPRRSCACLSRHAIPRDARASRARRATLSRADGAAEGRRCAAKVRRRVSRPAVCGLPDSRARCGRRPQRPLIADYYGTRRGRPGSAASAAASFEMPVRSVSPRRPLGGSGTGTWCDARLRASRVDGRARARETRRTSACGRDAELRSARRRRDRSRPSPVAWVDRVAAVRAIGRRRGWALRQRLRAATTEDMTCSCASAGDRGIRRAPELDLLRGRRRLRTSTSR